MPDFSITDILDKFGEKTKSTAADSSFDIDKIMSKFGKAEERKASDVEIKIRPILGQPGYQVEPGELDKNSNLPNPRDLLPKTNIGEKAYEADKAGKEMVSSGVSDFETGHPYKGAGKVLLGGFQRVTSPLTGIIEGGPEKIATEVTGNPDIGNRVGIVASSAIPVGGTAKTVVNAIPKNKALRTLVENIGPENLPSVVKDMKANPRLAPADLSPRVLQDAQHLFTSDGPQINYLANASAARLAGAKGAATSAFDASMGATVNAAQKLEDLKTAARDIGKKNIEPVLAAKPHVDVTGLIKTIDKEIGYPAMKAIKEGKAPPLPLTPYQRELLDVRNKLRNPSWPEVDATGKAKPLYAYTDQLHDAQIALRENAQGLTGSAVGSERNTGSKLLAFREQMKNAVGPEYKEALGKYAGQKKVEEAFHTGYDTILANSKKLENDPSFFEKWVKSPSRKPGELEAAREGARLRIEAEINGARTAATNPAAKATGIGQTEFSVKRLEALLGKEEAGKLLKTLDDERKIANTHGKIVEGSQTAMRTASKEQFALPTKTEVMKSAPAVAASEAANYFYGGFPGAATGALVAAKGVAAAKDIIATKLAREHNFQYAKYALPTEGPRRDALIKSLEAAIPQPKLSNRSKLRMLVSP